MDYENRMSSNEICLHYRVCLDWHEHCNQWEISRDDVWRKNFLNDQKLPFVDIVAKKADMYIKTYAHYLGDYKSPDTMLQDFEYQIQICSIERNMDYCLMKKFSTDLDFQNYRKQLTDIYLLRIIFSTLRLKLLLATHCQVLSGYYHSQT